MRSRIVFLVLLTGMAMSIRGQVNKYGVPLYSSYNLEPTGASEYSHCMTKDNNGIVYFGNDGRGILRFDGTTWTLIPVTGNPTLYAIAADTNNVIYAGGTYEFGYISTSLNGSMSYKSLSERLDSTVNIGNIMSIIPTSERIIISSTRNVFFYYPDSDSIVRFDGAARGLRNMWRMADINGKIIISDNIQGLFEIQGDTLKRIPGSDHYKRKVCRVMLPAGGNKVVIGTPSDGISLFDIETGEVDEVYIENSANELLISGKIYTGTKVGDSLFAVGTLDSAGVMVFDFEGRLIYQFTTESIGLSNNLVTSVYSNDTRLEELWICSIGTATKVFMGLPFTYFSNHHGITGGVNGIAEFNNTVFISHDKGVSKLTNQASASQRFTPLKEISVPTYPITLFEYNSDRFLIAGSQAGGFVIDKNDRVRNIGDITVGTENSSITATGGIQALRTVDVRYILQSRVNPKILYLGISGYLMVLQYESDSRWRFLSEVRRLAGHVSMIFEDDQGRVWVSTNVDNSLHCISVNGRDSLLVNYNSTHGLPETLSAVRMNQIDSVIYLISSNGFYRFDEEANRFEPSSDVSFAKLASGFNINLIKADSEEDIWLGLKRERYLEGYIPGGRNGNELIYMPFNVLPNAPSYDMEEIAGKMWFAKSQSVYVADRDALVEYQENSKPFFNKIVIGMDSLLMSHSFVRKEGNGKTYPSMTSDGLPLTEIPFKLNDISFFWSSNDYFNEEKIQYSFFLEGFSVEWSKWDHVLYKDFSNLRYGDYKFLLKSKSSSGYESSEAIYEFAITKPWYATVMALILYFLAVAGFIWLIIKAYTRRLVRENLRLEGIVTERTREVVKQKEELESSIHYASRIQRALLPSEQILSHNIQNYFLLFKPRDIVSGDFYWMTKRADKLFIVAADCTGHGVPGAFMSLLGMSFLDEIVNKSSIQRADLILKELRIHVTNSLKQIGEEDEAKDGMDIALLMFDFTAGKVEFSGAYNPCFKIRKLTEYEVEKEKRGDLIKEEGSMSNGKYMLETVYSSKMPIGISARMNEDFILHQWDIEKGVSYYLFSDGYVDQFGSNGKKFMKKNFKKLLLDIQEYPMLKQKDILEETLKQWMGDLPQIDDILVIGLRTD
jgi:serine phosphatase RsbU (regulator of sigma subunit)